MRHRGPTAWLVAAGLLLAVVVVRATPASSAGGTVDSTFGTTGLAAVDFGNGSFDTVYDMAVLSDGKIVVAGKTDVGFGIARLTSAGVPDTAFGTGGTVSGAFLSEIRGVALQSDGKLVVAGRTASTGGSLVLARYTTAGVLDSTFGTAGKVTVTMTGANSGGQDVAVLTDGKILALAVDAGQLVVLRYSSAGVLDATFGTAGRYTSTLTSTGNDRLALQTDKVLVTGQSGSAGGVLRLTAAGAPDTYGTSGVATTANHVPRGIAVQTDGKSIVVGDFGSADTKALVVRRDTTGALDTSFGTGGVASITVPGLATASARAVAIESDGKVVVAGRLGDGTRQSLLFVARLTSAGVLDTAFGTGGIATVTTVSSQNTSSVDAIGLAGTTGYLLGGSIINTARTFPNDNDFVVVRVSVSDQPAGGGTSSTTVPGAVQPGESASSDPDTTQPSASNKVIAKVTTPVAGTVGFTKVAPSAMDGFRSLASMTITAPDATANQPLKMLFRVDVSSLPKTLPLGALSVVRDKDVAGTCDKPTSATPDPCVVSRSRTGDVVSINVLTSKASTWTIARPFVQRIFGDDRVASSIAVSRSSFADGDAGAVVLARADSFADALAATPLAVAKKGPLLLTSSRRLDDRVLSELTRVLTAGKPVYILGGENAVGPAIAERVSRWGYTVTRFAGDDRYHTAALVARQGLDRPKVVVETTGLTFADALTAGSLAARVGGAVLLTPGGGQSPHTNAYLAELQPQRYAVGGPAAASDPLAVPVVGADRYETAVLAARRYFDKPAVFGMASGESFADALSGGVHVAANGGPLLLAPSKGSLPAVVSIYLRTLTGEPAAFLYGGTKAVGVDIAGALQSALGG